jgi:hypothetical protein
MKISISNNKISFTTIFTLGHFRYNLREDDMEKARQVQSKILGNDLSDPLLNHFGKNEVFSKIIREKGIA